MKKTATLGILIILLLPAKVPAFHEGGEGFCEGCHELHGSGNERTGYQAEFAGNSSPLLKGPDPSSACLRCHGEDGAFYSVLSRDGSLYTPGGDFYWLRKTFTWNSGYAAFHSEGDNHGHNIIAADYGLGADSHRHAAPGDAYPASEMGCTSCHDPHARTAESAGTAGARGEMTPSEASEGNFRLLGGEGYGGVNQNSGIIFSYPAPVAVAHETEFTETDHRHVAYGSGMSEWCANCHSRYLNDGSKHPSGNSARLGSDTAANYNSYVRTGDISGVRETAYLSLVPFETGTDDAFLLDPFSTSGPDPAGEPNVMCLTCHRAHSSAFDDIGRWDFHAAFIADSHPREGDSGVTGSDVLHSYYGRDMTAEFGRYQRQLCNKCHLQD